MNQAINFFWTIICFAPVLLYWLSAGNLSACYIFIGIAFVSLGLPIIQLSHNSIFYEVLGVKFIRKFVQDGGYAKRLTGKTAFIKNKLQATNYLKTLRMYERYHILCFVFFMLTCIHSIFYKYYLLSVTIFFTNLIYNLFPIFLQQYNRLKIERILSMLRS